MYKKGSNNAKTSTNSTKMDKNSKRRALTGKKLRMYNALKDQLGIVTTAAKQAGIERTTHYTWMHKDPNYKEWVEEIPEINLDVVENALLSEILKGNTTAIIFYLKTKGRKRGYIERKEIDLSDERKRIVITKPYDDTNKLDSEQETSTSP